MQVQSTTRLPAILLTIGLRERVLLALQKQPLKMGELTDIVGTPAKKLWKVIDQLHRERVLRRLGIRRSTHWALSTYRGPLPKRTSASEKTKRRRAVKPPERGSWWLVPAEQFPQAAKARREAMGWDE